MYKLYIAKNVSTHDLLKKILLKYNLKNEIISNYYGKPYLKNNELYFSISHADDYIALVISNKEIGIDMEKITFKERIIPKVCTDQEKELIKTAEDFTMMWVKKESYVKYLGIGLGYGLQNVDTLKIKDFIIKKFKDYYIAIYGDDLD